MIFKNWLEMIYLFILNYVANCLVVKLYFSFQFRLVVKTALKLLLVFVEYSESNSLLLMNTVNVVDTEKGICYGESFDVKTYLMK